MNKVIIITGASSGFGKATAERLAKRGHTVYGICRREMSHPTIHYMQADIRDKEHIRQIINTIYEKEKHIDVLINNAGMGIGGSLELATTEEIQVQMGTNFMGCVNMCQEVLPYMRRQRSGKIINLSSIGGIMGLPYQGYYSASKFAIEGFSEALSAEVVGDEVAALDVKVRPVAVLALHHLKQMLAQLDGVVVAAGVQDGIGGLAGAGADLQHPRSRPDAGIRRKVREQLRAIARPEAVELLGDRIKNPPKFVFLHALTSTSSF